MWCARRRVISSTRLPKCATPRLFPWRLCKVDDHPYAGRRWHLSVLWVAALLIGSPSALAVSAGDVSAAPSPDKGSVEQGLFVQLSDQGAVELTLPCPLSRQILRLRIEGADALGALWLERLPVTQPGKPAIVITGPFGDDAISLPLSDAATEVLADRHCRLTLSGRPGAEVTVIPGDWRAVTFFARLLGMWHDWTTFRPWRHASINSHQTVVQAWHGLVPTVLLGVVFVTVGLAGYWRWRTRFLLWWMLACWLALDLPWQWRLYEQAGVTRDRFAGVAAKAKPGLAEDAALWAFAEDVKALLPAAESRVFVASASDYGGMRLAYYLYPLNVFWRRGGPELPASSAVQPGDYIVVVPPSEISIVSGVGRLQLGPQGWSARPLLWENGIVLFEVR